MISCGDCLEVVDRQVWLGTVACLLCLFVIVVDGGCLFLNEERRD